MDSKTIEFGKVARALAVALALPLAAGAHAEGCDWSNPGVDRYTGSADKALARYTDIPAPIRAKLLDKMERHAYDDRVLIDAATISGAHRYDPKIWGMFFGADKMCSTVRRAKLRAPQAALAYTVEGYTVLVPAICGNISRAKRLEDEGPLDVVPSAGPAGDAPGAALPPAAAPDGAAPESPASPGPDDIDMEPPGAGPVPGSFETGSGPAPSGSFPGGPGEVIFPPPPGEPAAPIGPGIPPIGPGGGVPAVPEPASWATMGLGLAMLAAWRKARAPAKASQGARPGA